MINNSLFFLFNTGLHVLSFKEYGIIEPTIKVIIHKLNNSN